MTRNAKMRLKVFVEGTTEKNYFSKLRKNNNVEISYEEINMAGGGYTEFLKQIKKKTPNMGCLAVFIVIDLDRYVDDSREREPFKKLYKFCKMKNKSNKTPHFLIVTNRSFEYFACLHCPSYKGSNTTKYIEKDFNYKDLDKFKSDKKVYEFLNRELRSFENAINKIKKQNEIEEKQPFINYDYKVERKNLDINIKVKREHLNEDAISYKHSNLEILFDIIVVKS